MEVRGLLLLRLSGCPGTVALATTKAAVFSITLLFGRAHCFRAAALLFFAATDAGAATSAGELNPSRVVVDLATTFTSLAFTGVGRVPSGTIHVQRRSGSAWLLMRRTDASRFCLHTFRHTFLTSHHESTFARATLLRRSAKDCRERRKPAAGVMSLLLSWSILVPCNAKKLPSSPFEHVWPNHNPRPQIR